MKTTIQELIEKWEDINIVARHTQDAALVKQVIEDAKILLIKERQIIISAHHDGQMYGIRHALSSTGESVKYVIDNYPIHNTFKL